jgi:hypothetical protein
MKVTSSDGTSLNVPSSPEAEHDISRTWRSSVVERPEKQITDQPHIVDLDILSLGYNSDLSQRLSGEAVKPLACMKERVGA